MIQALQQPEYCIVRSYKVQVYTYVCMYKYVYCGVLSIKHTKYSSTVYYFVRSTSYTTVSVKTAHCCIMCQVQQYSEQEQVCMTQQYSYVRQYYVRAFVFTAAVGIYFQSIYFST